MEKLLFVFECVVFCGVIILDNSDVEEGMYDGRCFRI